MINRQARGWPADGPGRCVEYLNFYFLDDDAEAPELEGQRVQTADAWQTIMGQDMKVLEDLQVACHSPIADQVAGMSPVWEVGTGAFRTAVANKLQAEAGA